MPAVTPAAAPAASRARRPSRKGVSLVEVIVVLVLIGVVGGAIAITLVRQQRFYRGTTELLQAREGVRDAMELLSTDIRGMAVADTIRLMADSAIEFFANVGGSVVCERPGATSLGIPGVAAGRGNVLTVFATTPDTGDIATFHNDSIDAWERHRISGFGPRSLAVACPASSELGRNPSVNSGSTGFLLELSTPPSEHIRAGAPVRFLRRGRYSLYRGSDGDWYLGYRRCNAIGASTCGAIQPLSGPYRGYSADRSRTGLSFEYFDRSGKPLAPGASPFDLARVEIGARAESHHPISVEGRLSVPSDSGTISIALRNQGH